MMQRMLARMMALILMVNLVLCVPLSAAAEEGESAFDADPVTVETTPNEGGTQTDVVVTETVPAQTVGADASTPGSGVAVGEQTVSVEIPVEEATTLTPVEGQTPAANEGGTAIEYDTTEDSTAEETIHVEESYDLTVEVTNAGNDAAQLTDIEYDVSLEQKVSTTPQADPAANSGSESGAQPDDSWKKPVKVNLSVNGMEDDPTRVEHKYVDSKGIVQTEYYYNEANGKDEADTSKKYFTVVKETAENVVNKVVSLWTNFLGKFHITNDAFENQNTKEMSTTLAEAANNAGDGSTVEMLRDYETDKTAIITTDKEVTVDLNEKTYTSNVVNNSAIWVTQGNQDVTIRNGTINSVGDGIYTYGTGNKITVEDVTLNTNAGGGKNNYNMGIWDEGANTEITVKDSTIISTGSYFGIYHNGSNGGAKISLIGSYVYADGSEGAGIYISGSTSTANNASQGLNSLELIDSTVKGDTGIEVKFTNVTINNSTLVGFGTPPEYTENNNGSTTIGAALAVTDNANGITGGTIIINSGKFSGHKDIDNIYQAVKDTTGDNKASITILGGRYVNAGGLYPFIPEDYAAISYNDGSEYIYEVVAKGYVPTRSGYTFLGYKDDKGNAITLKEASAQKVVAYAQWEPAPESTVETPKAEENNNNNAVIIVEADTKGNNVDVTIQDTTAQVTVSTPAGEAAAVSEVTIPSVEQLREQGVDTVSVQVEENVILELGVSANVDNGLGDSIVITRNEDTLVISSGEETNITIHMEALKAASTEAVHIRYDEGVITVSFGSTVVFRMEVLEALRANKDLTIKLEGKVLKLYDKDNNLIQQIPM